MASGLLSEVPFASLFVYSPRGQSEISRRSRRLRDAIKRGDEETIRNCAQLAAQENQIREYFNEALLIPCPRSSPLIRPDALWPGRLLSEAFFQARLGIGVNPCLTRTSPVPKSAFQGPGSRPTAQTHFETIAVKAERPFTISKVVVVDDFITKGNTMLGAVSRVSQVFPSATVLAFALVRTLGLQPEVDRILDPCFGKITNIGGEADRHP